MSLLLLLLGCPGEATSCDSLCNHLVLQCGYAAFPDLDSCLQGCGYEQEQGGRIDDELRCIETASCDTFAILDCERRFGVQAE